MRLAAAIAAILLCLPLAAANVRLYLTDGTHHVVREYEVKEDRVRFYSVERSDWEEMPLDLVDLKRTKSEVTTREAETKASKDAAAVERKAERELEREIESVPSGAGPYWLSGKDLKPLKQAESKVVGNKRRSVLKAMSPIPVVTGKSTLELDGGEAALSVARARPEFYFRLAKEERFALVRLSLNKGNRVVQRWTMVPVTKELIEEHDEVASFRHQVGDGLYKIWPQKPMEPGQYAFVEYTEGKGNTQVWDFAVTAEPAR